MAALGIKLLSEVFRVHFGLIFFHSESAGSKYFNSEIDEALTLLALRFYLEFCANSVHVYVVLES